MVHFVGAGAAAPDLITLRGKKLLEEADTLIYAGSLVNTELLSYAKKDCRIYDSAKMTLEEVLEAIMQTEREGMMTVRLHSGDSSLYGAIREQMRELDKYGVSYDVCPGVSAFCGAAAALNAEYTLPGVSQSVVITRMAGRTPVPERESIRSFAAHGASMVIFLSTGMLPALQSELMAGGYAPDTPAAIVYKASWEDQKVCLCTVSELAKTAEENKIYSTALITVGGFLGDTFARSKLYDPAFETGFRKATEETE